MTDADLNVMPMRRKWRPLPLFTVPPRSESIADAAARGAELLRKLSAALPLDVDLCEQTGIALVKYCDRIGREPGSLTIDELATIAAESRQQSEVGEWYALGKRGESWYAVAPPHALNPFPIVAIARGRRRRLLHADELVEARPFVSRAAAHAAGRCVFDRTYVHHLTAKVVS